ncbi:MAG: RnfABCDGE type electron transport complex subunit D [Verrucomicrobia bacterium]|nr:RnfABCDGE type electron transport complex subunit D [Verrucomicrobiota bacterium]MCH8512985.1 RnfABCDGE type electron transport complex subunit D [Kiritimatiellia bacterium]
MTDSAVQLKTSPHLRGAHSVDKIMRHVVYALLPICLFSVYQFGLSVLALILCCTLVCVGTEDLFCRLNRRPGTVGDWSAVITGILLALILPPSFPLWMAAVASFVSIGVGKLFFGGLGFNVFNPALVGRAFAQAAFTVPITTWTPAMVHVRFREFIPSTFTFPFAIPPDLRPWMDGLAIDGFTGATPLALMKFDHIDTEAAELFVGTVAGSAGETSSLLILLCGCYLAFRKMLNWKIVASVLGSAALFSWIFWLKSPELYPTPLFTLTSGGLMLGAVFMATDMVSSPVTPMGIVLYGILIGVVTVMIRLFGGLNEGVMYAILLANAATPLLNDLTQPRIYGATRKRKRKEVKA